MPDRSFDLPPLSILGERKHRQQDDQARRMALLDATVLRWLSGAGMPQASASVHARALAPIVGRWLDDTNTGQQFELLPSLADRLRMQLTPSNPPPAAAFVNAFAHSLVAHAVDEVALEARRAGHANVYAGLHPWLHSNPTPAILAQLGATLRMPQSALSIALSRLRRRLRERIEAALTLWASSPETRDTLRRRLRESLIGTESTP